MTCEFVQLRSLLQYSQIFKKRWAFKVILSYMHLGQSCPFSATTSWLHQWIGTRKMPERVKCQGYILNCANKSTFFCSSSATNFHVTKILRQSTHAYAASLQKVRCIITTSIVKHRSGSWLRLLALIIPTTVVPFQSNHDRALSIVVLQKQTKNTFRRHLDSGASPFSLQSQTKIATDILAVWYQRCPAWLSRLRWNLEVLCTTSHCEFTKSMSDGTI